jgi:FkbM family methyltransferase
MNFETFISHLPAGAVRILADMFAPEAQLERSPGWHFGIAEEKPDRFVRYRLAIWKYFQQQKIEDPVVVSWYHGIRFNLHLGNDTSRLLYVGGSLEPNEFFFLNQFLKPGMVVMDVGANEGLYSLFASSRIGPGGIVLAIEPSEREFIRLKKNIALNQMTNIRTFRCALYSERGLAELAVAEYEHAGQNTLGKIIPNPKVRMDSIQQVDLEIFDDLFEKQALNRLDFVKIDAEGAEMQVLLGAQKTIRHYLPLIQLEVSEQALKIQDSSRDGIFELLQSWGYRFYAFDARGELSQADSPQVLDGNVIASPAGRILN